MMDHRLLLWICSGLVCVGISEPLLAAEPAGARIMDFNRDVRPILSNNCYACHGPDKNKRKANLRLDIKEGVFVGRKAHPASVIPGKPDESELYRRITSQDADERMPAPGSGKTLSAGEIATIKKWIEQGAPWKGHWAYIKPVLSPVPAGDGSSFVRNQVDQFILARLNEAGLRPSSEADKTTLIRRLYFDLLGLPPTKAEVDRFLQDNRPNAYELLVDRLLDSPHYGERMALFWLDLVRYADTIGYHSDNPMNVFPYRDYVIRAFNQNKRFDQFTTEQLAGDLLPNATLEHKIASAYNRLLQTTEEGGAQAKEYEAKYAADRVRNVSSVWLGATMGCCQCHDHKFDPFTIKDFYRFAAFFADVQEAAVGRREPGMPVPNEKQAAALKKMDAEIAPVKKKFDAATAQPKVSEAEWERIFGTSIEMHLLEKRKEALLAPIPKTLIAVAGPPRVVRILARGNWQDDSGEVVGPGAPLFLAQLDVKERRPTRLDLARWIVARDNPLTARVFVNRLWKLYFGQGLSKGLEDLGAQGEWPTHPELLDYLAIEFMESGWDVKHVVRLLLTSGSYRQTSKASPVLKEKDPFNRLIARQSRFRLDAEIVRDSTLAVSGLLSPKIGGPSVKPYQPAGYWSALNFPTREWYNDRGEGLYRRGLYTHWQRSFLHPSLLAFDAPTREECCVDRPRSNIPQQALALLNDPTYVEAARVLAARIMKEGGATVPERLNWAFGQVVSRKPKDDELRVMAELFDKHSAEFAADSEAAKKLVSTGASPVPENMKLSDLAAWTSVARTLLNLHETITRY